MPKNTTDLIDEMETEQTLDRLMERFVSRVSDDDLRLLVKILRQERAMRIEAKEAKRAGRK